MLLERFRHRIRDRLNAVAAETNGARAANAFQVLHEQLHFIPMIAITQEQGAHAAECFGHCKDVRSRFTYVKENLARRAVHIINCDISHAEWRIHFICRATQNLRTALVLFIKDLLRLGVHVHSKLARN
ncbi:hypothetical protein D3C71_1801010 [compost metagenome]